MEDKMDERIQIINDLVYEIERDACVVLGIIDIPKIKTYFDKESVDKNDVKNGEYDNIDNLIHLDASPERELIYILKSVVHELRHKWQYMKDILPNLENTNNKSATVGGGVEKNDISKRFEIVSIDFEFEKKDIEELKAKYKEYKENKGKLEIVNENNKNKRKCLFGLVDLLHKNDREEKIEDVNKKNYLNNPIELDAEAFGRIYLKDRLNIVMDSLFEMPEDMRDIYKRVYKRMDELDSIYSINPHERLAIIDRTN